MAIAFAGSAAEKLLDRRNLDFLLYDWLHVESLLERERFADHSRESFDQTLDLASNLAAAYFAPHNALADAREPYFENGRIHVIPEVKPALDEYRNAGLIAASHDFEIGGIQLPYVVSTAALAYFLAANAGTATYAFLTSSNANVIAAFGTDEQKRLFLEPLLEGRFFGTMVLTEPHAGSSLAEIATRAESNGDGTYSVIGNKMWISGADHDLSENIVHLVLAKLPDAPPGVKGISLFIVPKFLVNDDGSLGEKNDVAVAGVNHKMGYRGAVNCALNFGENGGATGYLVGEPHRGLQYMFHMMNEARVLIGVGAAAIASASYLQALGYARDRKQGRAQGERDPRSPQVNIVDHADVRRMLLEQKAAVEGALALCLYAAKLVDEKDTAPDAAVRRDAAALLDFLTPIVKAWSSQSCVRASDLAIQVHGGYGYSREYIVEQLYRDNRLNPIHEGTDGIQSIDLLGRKAVMHDGAAFELWIAAVGKSIAAARTLTANPVATELANAVAGALDEAVRTTESLARALPGNAPLALANATAYMELIGRTSIAWMWLEQVVALADRDDDFARGKRHTARFYARYELENVATHGALLRSLDDTFLTMEEAWF